MKKQIALPLPPPHAVAGPLDAEKTLAVLRKHAPHRTTIAGYEVNTDSQRFPTFYREMCCVECGLPISHAWLVQPPGSARPHVNFYGRRDGEWVLFTKDHIIPRSLGGPNLLDNYQTMCAPCNERRANDVSLADISELAERLGVLEKVKQALAES